MNYEKPSKYMNAEKCSFQWKISDWPQTSVQHQVPESNVKISRQLEGGNAVMCNVKKNGILRYKRFQYQTSYMSCLKIFSKKGSVTL